jgi:hypothetical protein
MNQRPHNGLIYIKIIGCPGHVSSPAAYHVDILLSYLDSIPFRRVVQASPDCRYNRARKFLPDMGARLYPDLPKRMAMVRETSRPGALLVAIGLNY